MQCPSYRIHDAPPVSAVLQCYGLIQWVVVAR